MKEIISINYNDELPTVLGRDLHEALGVKEKYSEHKLERRLRRSLEAIYRRFKLLDKEKEKALLQLVEEKCLTANDLSLILSTISINQTFC